MSAIVSTATASHRPLLPSQQHVLARILWASLDLRRCVRSRLKRFLIVTRCREYLSSGEKRAGCADFVMTPEPVTFLSVYIRWPFASAEYMTVKSVSIVDRPVDRVVDVRCMVADGVMIDAVMP